MSGRSIQKNGVTPDIISRNQAESTELSRKKIKRNYFKESNLPPHFALEVTDEISWHYKLDGAKCEM